jgi:hypothetical protein
MSREGCRFGALAEAACVPFDFYSYQATRTLKLPSFCE